MGIGHAISSSIQAARVQQTALSFGMRQRKRESHALHTDELGTGDLPLALGVAGFVQEQPYSFLEVLQGLFFGAATRGHVQLQGVRHVGAPLFEDAGFELNLHTSRLMVALEG